MKEYCNDNNLGRHKRRKKSKGHAPHGFAKSFFVFWCCLIVMILTIGFVANNFPFVIDQQPNAHLSINKETNPNLNTGLVSNAQNH